MMRSDRFFIQSMRGMQLLKILQVVRKDDLPVPVTTAHSLPVRLIVQWVVGIAALFGLGTWLVWWEATVQRSFVMEDIRGACQRIMPETADRCVDTVVIQRGGGR